jgi:molybdopterin-guanine dinucleotide biosynthesis protein A
MITNLTAVVLAGGQSKRFGSPKALARLNGKPLIHLACETASLISPYVMASCNDDEISKQLTVRSFTDRYPNAGPLGGILTALSVAPTPYVTFIPCDMPFLEASIYQKLWEFNREHPESIIVAQSHRGLEPLIAIWPTQMLSHRKVTDSISSNDYALYKLFRQLPVVPVNFPLIAQPYNEKWFFNVNTTSELQQAHQWLLE